MTHRITDGYLELYHPETDSWVKAIAPLQVSTGLEVRLATLQHDLISSIHQVLQGVEGGVGAAAIADLKQQVQEIERALTEAGLLSQQVNTLSTSLTSVLTRSTETRDLVQGLLDANSDETGDSITRLGEIGGAIAAQSGNLQGIEDATSSGGHTVLSRFVEALTHLGEIRDRQRWRETVNLNSGSPIFDAAASPAVSTPMALSSEAHDLAFQFYFSDSAANSSVIVEMRDGVGATGLGDRWFSANTSVGAGDIEVTTGIFAGNDYVTIPRHGAVECVLHLQSISAGNVTIYGREIR